MQVYFVGRNVRVACASVCVRLPGNNGRRADINLDYHLEFRLLLFGNERESTVRSGGDESRQGSVKKMIRDRCNVSGVTTQIR